MAKRLCSIEIEMKVVDGKTTSSIESYTACRLIPLEKKPDGVRPIGIGKVRRRIIGKAVLLSVFKEDVMQSAGSLQLRTYVQENHQDVKQQSMQWRRFLKKTLLMKFSL